jgi:ABC-type bacteriocin/lantibiotic exporter with double-glycine peptidase domain
VAAGVGLASLARMGAHRHYASSDGDAAVRYRGYDRVVRQTADTDCGPAGLKMIMDRHGVHVPLDTLAGAAGLTPLGTSFMGLRRAAERFGFAASGWRLDMRALRRLPLPVLVKVGGCHFAVVERITEDTVVVLDPKEGEVHLPVARFASVWDGVALILEKRGEAGKQSPVSTH